MKFSFLLFLSTLSFLTFSQITIDNTDMVSGEAEFIYSVPQDINLNYAFTGPNTVWDFSTLSPASQFTDKYNNVGSASLFVLATFGAFATTNYQASYFAPSDDLPFDQIPPVLPVTIEDINRFSKITADSVTQIGFSIVVNGQEVPFRSDTIEKAYDFPLNFGDTYTSRGYSFADLNPIYDAKYVQHRQRATEVDGWGQLTTPYGSFETIRLHHTINETDSFYVSFGGAGNWIGLPVPVSHIYEWWGKDEGVPLLTITTQEVGGNQTTSEARYKDNAQEGLGLTEDNLNAVKLFPNPTVNSIEIKSELEIKNCIIYAVNGEVVLNSTLNSIDVSSLQTGNYRMEILLKNGKRISKVFSKQ